MGNPHSSRHDSHEHSAGNSWKQKRKSASDLPMRDDVQKSRESGSMDAQVTIHGMMMDLLKQQSTTTQSSTTTHSAAQVAEHEKFFIAFHQKHQKNRKDDSSVYETAIQHRVAFVSLVGLYASFRRVPTHILFSAIFILKIKREWLLHPTQHVDDANNVLHKLSYDKNDEFMQMLQWKDSQGLLVCMYHHDNADNDDDADCQKQQQQQQTPSDEHIDCDSLPNDLGIGDDTDQDERASEFAATPVPPMISLRLRLEPDDSHLVANEHDGPCPPRPWAEEKQCLSVAQLPRNILVHPLWQQLSQRVRAIYDPFEGCNYGPLILDETWWSQYFSASQYGTTAKEVAHELTRCEMSYRSVMEILFQSNPSLIPCKTFRDLENVSSAVHGQLRPQKLTLPEINLMWHTSSSMTAFDSLTDLTCEFSNHVDIDDNDSPFGLFGISPSWIHSDYDHDAPKLASQLPSSVCLVNYL